MNIFGLPWVSSSKWGEVPNGFPQEMHYEKIEKKEEKEKKEKKVKEKEEEKRKKGK